MDLSEVPRFRTSGVEHYSTYVGFGRMNIVDRSRQLNVTVNGKNNYYILIDTNFTKYYSCSWRNP